MPIQSYSFSQHENTPPIRYDPDKMLPPDEAGEVMGRIVLDAIKFSRHLNQDPGESARILIPGVGPGTLICAIAASLEAGKNSSLAKGAVEITGFDINTWALEMAEENIWSRRRKMGNIAVKLEQADWNEPATWASFSTGFTIVAVNPPYLPGGEPIRSGYEGTPDNALYSGEDGLDDYRTLLPNVARHLSHGPGSTVLGRYGVPGSRQRATDKLAALLEDSFTLDPLKDALRMLPSEGISSVTER